MDRDSSQEVGAVTEPFELQETFSQ